MNPDSNEARPPLRQQRSNASLPASNTPTRRLSMLDASTKNQKSFAEGKILTGITDGVGIVTFNNPEKRNAMSIEMW
ncbi:MAG: hypothetical protein WA832_02425, partial [Bradyrhizobium sp.]